MEKINSYSELSKLIFKHLRKGVFTNFFMSKEEVEEFISDNIFYYIEDSNFLLLLRDMNTHYIINFYLNDYKNCNKFWESISSLEKMVVFETAYKLDNKELIEDFCKIAFKNGFNNKLERIKLYKTEDVSATINIDDITIRFANCDEVHEICELFSNSFDKYIGCIPTESIIEKNIEDDNIMVAIKDDRVAGLLRFLSKNNEIIIKHLAVKSEYRRMNIGKMLVAELINNNPNKKISVWTGKENSQAIRVYEVNGFITDNYMSKVFVSASDAHHN